VQNIHKKIFSEMGQSAETRRGLFSKLSAAFDGRTVVSYFTSFAHPVQIADSDCDMLQSVFQQLDLTKGLVLVLRAVPKRVNPL
jgi:hypothetical protein